MNNRKFFSILTVCLSLAIVAMGFTMVSCDTDDITGGGKSSTTTGTPGGTTPGVTPPPAGSVDNFADLEPKMAPNPNRAVTRAGGSTEIEIPDYLLEDDDEGTAKDQVADRSARAVTATFAVHEDDRSIAQIVAQNGRTCTVKGLTLGSARIVITVGSKSATVIMAVAPSDAFYRLPATQVVKIGQGTYRDRWWSSDQPDDPPSDYEDYFAEPMNQLAWNWRNPSQYYGASGTPCGIDVMSYYVDPLINDRRGWVRTTFGFGGWFYDLNGVTNKMTDGVQVNGDVELKIEPEFFYDNGVPYLQITHTLTNNGSVALTGQKFGASADVMILHDDQAPLTYIEEYGALMTNESYDYYDNHLLPTMKIRLVCQSVPGVDDVSTLWLGRWGGGNHRDYVYDDQRDDITIEDYMDTAMGFSYQDIDLKAGESKTFVLRFTQVQ